MERKYAVEAAPQLHDAPHRQRGLGYFTRDFVGAGINENQLTGAVGLEYYMNRHAVLFGRYQHTAFDSSSADRQLHGRGGAVGVRLRN